MGLFGELHLRFAEPDSPGDLIDPEYAPVEFDDAAFAELFSESENYASDGFDDRHDQ